MNKRQKIIVSIVGITIVLLALLGLTYAYYLTRIEGNTNTNSISVTTADLRLTYNDGDSSIIGSGKTLIPDNNNPVGTKVFTVTNNGNEVVEDYAVIIENFAVKYQSGELSGVVTNFVNGEDGKPDMKLVVTCKAYKNYTTSKDDAGTCNGMDGFLPEKSDILVINSIDKEITHEYTATLTYLEDGTNQSVDMNKTITGKFNIIDTKGTVDITGTVATYANGDYVTIHSDPKESVIYPDGTYKFMGVKPDEHKIEVYNRNNTETPKGGSELSIIKGEEAGIQGNVITINDSSRLVTIDITNTYTINIDKITEMVVKDELKDLIITNTTNQKNGTLLVNRPESPIGYKISTDWIYGTDENNYFYLAMHSYPGVQYIAETSEDLYNCLENVSNNNYTFESSICPNVIEGNNSTKCIDAKGKYIFGPYGEIYIADCDDDYYLLEDAKFEKTIVNENNSFYYRGMVNDNFLNYNGMCWRIVSIQEDGSIKIVLEDQYDNCNETTDTDNDGKIFTGNWIIGSGIYGFNVEGDSFQKDYLNPNVYNERSMKIILDNWFNNSNFDLKDLKKETWTISSKQSSTLESYIFSLTARDCLKAGAYSFGDVGGSGETQSINYLINNFYVNYSRNSFPVTVIESTGESFAKLTSTTFLDSVGVVVDYFIFYPEEINTLEGFIRPVVVLKDGIKASGDGTLENPYVIE